MREDGLDPMHFFTAGHIRPNREFAKIIAPFYENVTADETYGAMRGMVRVHHLLQATSSQALGGVDGPESGRYL